MLYVCSYRLHAVNPCEIQLQSSPENQSDGLPLLEHALEGAHLIPLACIVGEHLSGCRYIYSKLGGIPVTNLYCVSGCFTPQPMLEHACSFYSF